MANFWRAFSLSLLLATTVGAAVAKPQLHQVESVRVGISSPFNAMTSFSDGAAVIVTSPPKTRHKGFSLSKIVDKRAVTIADFPAKLMSIKSDLYYIREAKIAVDRKDNIIVMFSLFSTSGVTGLETGTELQVAIFDKNGRLKYSNLVDSSIPRSHINELNVDVLPNGNFLSVYNISDKKTKVSGREMYVSDVHMAIMKPSGSVISLQQVSLAADHKPKGDNSLTGDGLRSGHNVTVTPSGDFRIVWSHGVVAQNGELGSEVAAANYGQSGQLKSLKYHGEYFGRTLSSLSTFYRNRDFFSDAVVNRSTAKSEYFVQFFKVRERGKRKLIRERSTGYGQAAWTGASQFDDKYAFYISQTESIDCHIYRVNLDSGNALGSKQISTGALRGKCSDGAVARMADNSIGVVINISGKGGNEIYFMRYSQSDG